MKTPLGTEVDIGAGHIVLDGFPALRERDTAPPLRPTSIVATVAPLSVSAELLFLKRKTSYIHGPSLAERVEHDTDALTLVDGDGPRTAGRAGGDGARSRRCDVAGLIRQSSTRFVRRARFARHYKPQSGGRSSPRCVRARIHMISFHFTTNGSNNRVSRTKNLRRDLPL